MRNRHKEERVSRYGTRRREWKRRVRSRGLSGLMIVRGHAPVDNKTRYNGLCTMSAERIRSYVRACVYIQRS